ncbi:alpha/beta fold hydrolase [Streptomyces sp. NPDC001985]|uniref:alpha/beta fold hydrolase n=1 Tax=Streptomyces sp. NPDC001985 TaxID=3154406 RepID=UPI00332AA859
MSHSAYTSQFVDVPGGRIHVVEHGEGPLVVLVHGFPESWYSWRHQIPALAAAGYRVAAIDVRGHGRSFRPEAREEYGILHLVSDVVGVIGALGGTEPAVVVGHDWGSATAAHTALFRPDLVRAVGLMSVPYAPRDEHIPSVAFASLAPEGTEFYMSYFRRPGPAEAEIEEDTRAWLRGFYSALSAGTGDMGVFLVPEGRRMRDAFPAATPGWLTDEVLDRCLAEMGDGAVTPALNRYRCMDSDWSLTGAWAGLPVRRPALYIGGDQDAPTRWMEAAIRAFPRTLPGARTHILEECGHWMPQEKPDEVNELLIDWLNSLPEHTG